MGGGASFFLHHEVILNYIYLTSEFIHVEIRSVMRYDGEHTTKKEEREEPSGARPLCTEVENQLTCPSYLLQ